MKINSITSNRTRKAVALCLVVLAVATGSLSLFAEETVWNKQAVEKEKTLQKPTKNQKQSNVVNAQTKKATVWNRPSVDTDDEKVQKPEKQKLNEKSKGKKKNAVNQSLNDQLFDNKTPNSHKPTQKRNVTDVTDTGGIDQAPAKRKLKETNKRKKDSILLFPSIETKR